MSIIYPLSPPTARGPRGVTIRARSAVGMSVSPFTFSQQVYVHQGEMWELDVEIPPVRRSDAEEWVAFLLALNGREGTFLMGDPVNISPRGNWSGAATVNGAGQLGKVLNIHGLAAGATGRSGDWFQLGTGASSTLHKLTLNFTASGAGAATINFWPRLRRSPPHNAPIITSSPRGLWRLAGDIREWSMDLAAVYGIKFAAIEAL